MTEYSSNPEAEADLLGSLLLDPDRLWDAKSIVEPDDFVGAGHAGLFQTLCELLQRAQPIGLASVAGALPAAAREALGGLQGIVALQERIVSTAHVVPLARIVRDAAERTRLAMACQGVSEAVCQPHTAPGELLDEAEGRLLEALRGRRQSRMRLLSDYGDAIETEATPGDAIDAIRLKTGLHPLDDMLCGLGRGALYVVGGRPSMGKTSLALSIAMRAAEQRKRVLIFTTEVPAKEMTRNMLCQHARLSVSDYLRGRLSGDERARLKESRRMIEGPHLWGDDTARMTPAYIQANARIACQRLGGLDLVIVDYVQLLAPNDPKDSRERQVAEASSTMKAVAMDCDVPVLALSQLNRLSEHAENKRPRLSHLRESGSLEQDADAVLLLYRESYYTATNKTEADPLVGEDAEVIVAKNRHGEVGVCKLMFTPAWMRFDSPAKPYQSAEPWSREAGDEEREALGDFGGRGE